MNPNPENQVPTIASGGSPLQTSESAKVKRNGLTITKRNNKPNAKYTVRIRFRGKVHELTLAETAKESFDIAIRARREIHAGRYKEYHDATGLRGKPQITRDQLQTAYMASAVEANEHTRTQNWHALEQLLGDRQPSAISAPLAADWFKLAQEKADKEPDQLRQATIKRSANSRYRQAASVFAPRAMASYKLASIDTADFEKFLAAGELHSFTKLPKQHYNPPSEKIIADTLAAWDQLEDRNLFLALGHELAFGLRAGETVQAKWNWWTEREGYPVLDGRGEFKNGSGIIQVRALDPWFTILRTRAAAKAWTGQPDDYILTGTPTQRADIVYRAASAWLRAQGWQTQKTNHALRAYAGSQVAMRYSIYDAQTWLRHSSVTVTEQHYTHFIKQFRPADVTAMPVKWSLKEKTFVPIILPAVATS